MRAPRRKEISSLSRVERNEVRPGKIYEGDIRDRIVPGKAEQAKFTELAIE